MIRVSLCLTNIFLFLPLSLLHDDWFDWDEEEEKEDEVSGCNRTTVLAPSSSTLVCICIGEESSPNTLPLVSITNDYVNRQSWVVIEKTTPMKDSFVFNKIYIASCWWVKDLNRKRNLYRSIARAQLKERERKRGGEREKWRRRFWKNNNNIERDTTLSKYHYVTKSFVTMKHKWEKPSRRERKREKIDPIDFLCHFKKEMDTVKKLQAPFRTVLAEETFGFSLLLFFSFIFVLLLTCD